VVEIGKIKNAGDQPIYAPDREKVVLERISATNRGPLPDRTLAAIYRELMSGSFALEKPLCIAFLGPDGSYSHMAAMNKFGASVAYEPINDIRGVFEEVARRRADFGVVPVENSSGGGVIDTLDAFVETDVRVCAEVQRLIHHNLLANGPLDEINEVYSKPEVFTQCQRWLSETGLTGKTIAVASSSKAAEMAADKPRTAAIGSTLAADRYGLKIVCANIEDNANNVTRFFVISREISGPTGSDKTSLMFTVSHKAGALVDLLNVFRDEDINLTMITSRPSKKRNWEYYFFVDAQGHIEDASMQRAVAGARDHCLQLSVLGSFPISGEPT
jgi:chorismate mutase/prephenate dehydratase